MQPQMTPVYSLCPFPRESLPLAWSWLDEFPLANFDDYGPATEEAFCLEMARRLAAGESLLGVKLDGELVGFLGYATISPRLAAMHGICFTKRVHGSGIAAWAVNELIETLYQCGVEKLSAHYFADNEKIRRLLAKCGAHDEGLLRIHTLRQGVPLDLRLVAFYGGKN
jgi:RimJ/RimL family protein N-acetyltransferase